MKKISVLVMVAAMLALSSVAVLAKSENAGSGVAVANATVTPMAGSGVANQNQVKTQNAGEDQQLMVNTAEQEESMVGTKSAAPRSEVAIQHMSEVAKGVEEILTTKSLKGGIGDQVRVIAQDQKQSQDQVRLQIDKVASRSGLLKSIFGPDYKALSNIEGLIAQNELRIQQLTELKTQLTNSGDIEMVQQTIDSLIQQNVSLQDVVNTEQNQGSLLGWLIRLFVK